MEIFKDVKSSSKIKEFADLLNSKFNELTLEEGKVYEGKITKISPNNKMCWVEIPSGKSEGMLDDFESKILLEDGKLKLNEKIRVLVIKQESRSGEMQISYDKMKRLEKWSELLEAYEKGKDVFGTVVSRIKGGWVVSIDGTMTFMPGSQVDLKPLKSINHLMNQKIRLRIVKADKVRGNIVVSRRLVLEKMRNLNKEEALKRFKIGQIIDTTIKGIEKFGVFHDCDAVDSLTHVNEVSWNLVENCAELFTVGQPQKVVVLKVENGKLSTSIKRLSKDPFESEINRFSENQKVSCTVSKILPYGCFCRLENSSLSGLLHNSYISWTDKKATAQKYFSVSQKISCVVTNIDAKARRIQLDHRQTLPNDWEEFGKKFKIDSIVTGKLVNAEPFGFFVKIDGFNLSGMVHISDCSYNLDDDDVLKTYKKGDLIKAKLKAYDPQKEVIKLSIREALGPDPYDYLKNKLNKILTVKVLEIQEKSGLLVVADGCPNFKILIKKANLSMHKENCRVSRFNPGDRLDALLTRLNYKPRKLVLSIRALEIRQNEEAIEKYGSAMSGRALPFSSLSETLEKKDKKEKK